MSPDSNFVHAYLTKILMVLPEDYEPYGKSQRDGLDCSSGCSHFLKLEGDLSSDWGVCCNSRSHRCGLLTFEHQGCLHFTTDPVGKEGH